VLPGRYQVSIETPGVARALRGTLAVQADPLDKGFSSAERRKRQDAMLSMFELQKRLAGAQATLRSLGPAGDTRGGRLQAEFDRLMAVAGGLVRALEEFNSAPTVDQQRQMQWALEDERRALAVLNGLR
jgi:hypothetical protein